MLRIAIALLALTGCFSRTQSFRKSAVAMHPTPPAWGGRAVPGLFSLGLRSSGQWVPPDPEPDRQSGVYASQLQGGLDARFQAFEQFGIAALFEMGADRTAQPATANAERRPKSGPPWAFGTGASFTLFSGAFQVGSSLDLLLYSIPIRLNAINGGASERRSIVAGYVASVVPSLRVTDALSLFAGFTLRNHPDIERASTEVIVANFDAPEGAHPGEMNALISVGASAVVSDGVMLRGQVYQVASDRPIQYRHPGVEIGAVFAFGEPLSARKKGKEPESAPPHPAPPPPEQPAPLQL